jgi:hypothetical protein
MHIFYLVKGDAAAYRCTSLGQKKDKQRRALIEHVSHYLKSETRQNSRVPYLAHLDPDFQSNAFNFFKSDLTTLGRELHYLLPYSLSLLLSFLFSSFLFSILTFPFSSSRREVAGGGGPGHAERRRDEKSPWGGGTTSRVCGVATR